MFRVPGNTHSSISTAAMPMTIFSQRATAGTAQQAGRPDREGPLTS